MLAGNKRIGCRGQAVTRTIHGVTARSAGSTHPLTGFALICLLLALSGTGVGKEPEIHRCVQEDGTIAFQEMPCPEPVSTDDAGSEGDSDDPHPADEFFDFVNPNDEPERAPTPTETPPSAPPSRDRAECEKTTRDAIDAIDLEIRQDKSGDSGRAYLAQLLELTRQLRACKQL